MAALLMVRERRSQGRPGTQVIPTRWADDHRPVAAKTWTAEVELRRPGTTQTWSEADQEMVETPLAPYYSGPARVQVLATRDQSTVTVGDREVVTRYLVALDADVNPDVEDLATVTVIDDAHLAGRALLIAQVATGSLRFERDLFCSLTD